jgi:hypothetical protein
MTGTSRLAGSGSASTASCSHWAFFEEECQTIALILTAKPSRASYVKAFRLNDAALDLLPPKMTSGLNADDDAFCGFDAEYSSATKQAFTV